MLQHLYILYGTLAALALLVTWHDPDLRWVGLWLVGGWALSNVLDWYATIELQVAGYTFIEVMVALAVLIAMRQHRSWTLPAIVACNIVSIGVNAAFALLYYGSKRQIFYWEGTTNLIFAAECFLAFGVGLAHGIRTGRFDRWLHLCRRAVSAGLVRHRKP